MRVSRTISISPFAPLTPTPLKTSRDTLHPDTGERPGLLPCGARPGDGVTGNAACGRELLPSASLTPPSQREAMSGFKRFYKKYE